jgi:hypothetical protein
VLRGERDYSAHEQDQRKRRTLGDVNTVILEAEDTIDTETGHAWRQRRVVEEERDLDAIMSAMNPAFLRRYVPVHLHHRVVRAVNKLQVWDGSTYVDWVVSKTQGRDADWFVDKERGIVHLSLAFILRRGNLFLIDYDYGESVVPGWVKKATKYLAAADLEEAVVRPGAQEGGRFRSSDTRHERWAAEAWRLIHDHRELRSVGH